MSSAETTYLFRHALLRDAAYDLQLPGDRAVLHAMVLEIVESVMPKDDPQLDSWAGELAEHARLAQLFRRTAKLSDLKALGETEVRYLLRALSYSAVEYDTEAAITYGTRIGAHPAATHEARFTGLVRAGEVLLESGHPLKARPLFERARESAKTAADAGNEARALRALGISYARTEGPLAGIRWIEQALDAFRVADDKKGIGISTMNLGLLRAGTVPPEETLDIYQQALNVLSDADHRNGQAAVWNNMGNLLRQMGRREEAESALRNSIELHRAGGERHLVGSALGNLAPVLIELGRPEQADEANREAMRLARETGSRASEGIAILHSGITALSAGRLDEAEERFELSHTCALETGDPFWQGVALMNMAVLYQDRGELDRSAATGLRAKEVLQRVNARNELGVVIANLADVTGKRGDVEQARKLYEEALPMLADGHPATRGVHLGGYAVVLKILGAPDAGNQLHAARTLLEEYGTPADLQRMTSRWESVD